VSTKIAYLEKLSMSRESNKNNPVNTKELSELKAELTDTIFRTNQDNKKAQENLQTYIRETVSDLNFVKKEIGSMNT